MLNRRLARRIVLARADWLDEVECALQAMSGRRRSRSGAARRVSDSG